MVSDNLLQVLRQQPLGLVFDIDGTLSPIAPTPDEAKLYRGAAELLQEATKYAHVGIVTGRAVEDGARMVNLEGLTYVGTHGMEWSLGLPSAHNPAQIIPEAQPYIEPGKQLLNLIEEKLGPQIPGLIVQRKSIGGSLHYRLAQQPEQARELILSTIEEPARQLNMKIDEGKRVIEVLAPLTVNKGKALRRFVEQFDLQGIFFAGDDRTDVHAMLEIEKLRQEGLSAIAIAVQHPDTPPAVLEHADQIVQGVEEMIQLLQEVTETLRKHHS